MICFLSTLVVLLINKHQAFIKDFTLFHCGEILEGYFTLFGTLLYCSEMLEGYFTLFVTILHGAKILEGYLTL